LHLPLDAAAPARRRPARLGQFVRTPVFTHRPCPSRQRSGRNSVERCYFFAGALRRPYVPPPHYPESLPGTVGSTSALPPESALAACATAFHSCFAAVACRAVLRPGRSRRRYEVVHRLSVWGDTSPGAATSIRNPTPLHSLASLRLPRASIGAVSISLVGRACDCLPRRRPRRCADSGFRRPHVLFMGNPSVTAWAGAWTRLTSAARAPLHHYAGRLNFQPPRCVVVARRNLPRASSVSSRRQRDGTCLAPVLKRLPPRHESATPSGGQLVRGRPSTRLAAWSSPLTSNVETGEPHRLARASFSAPVSARASSWPRLQVLRG